MIPYLLDELILMFAAILVWCTVPNTSDAVDAFVIMAIVYAAIVLWHKVKNRNEHY